ncbi:MAG: 4Fe-4S binding protein [Deltaproteobacteria bacterium]|nr:4Fe-4S binding protein [Deltaproteobacteria bacterium]
MRFRILFNFISMMVLFGITLNIFSSERFPPPQFESGYVRPEYTVPMPRGGVWPLIDAIVLLSALGIASWLVHKKRSRRALFGLMVFSLAYFGFYRKGCVCSIGSIQDMSLFLFNKDYVVPLLTVFFFIAPLVFTLLFGRSFCAGVCPLGAVQDITLIKPVKVPVWLEHTLRYLAYVYLALAVWLAVMGSAFVICKYDPYVAIFRRNGNLDILIMGGILLVIGFFIGRPYCRFLCPYGVILRQLSRLSRWRVRITPTDCNQCRLCEEACPYGAIRPPVHEWPEASYANDKKRLALFLILLPFIIAIGAWTGNSIAPSVSRTHPAVALAERIWMEENQQAEGTTDASQYFRSSGETIGSLYKRAAVIRAGFEKGGWFFGGFLGFILGGKLILLSLRPRQRDYEAERAGCVSCGRCFRYCPKEQEKIEETGGLSSR